MTTRSFIKSLALLSGAAAGCPGIFIPKFEPVRWKVNPRPPYRVVWREHMPWPDAWMFLIDKRTFPNKLGISHTIEQFGGDEDENGWSIITTKSERASSTLTP